MLARHHHSLATIRHDRNGDLLAGAQTPRRSTYSVQVTRIRAIDRMAAQEAAIFRVIRLHCQSTLEFSRRIRAITLVMPALLAAALGGCTSLDATPSPTKAATDAASPYAALDTGRGKLFYDAQCVTCHTAEVHWRDNSIVQSWIDVVVQVDRWQQNTGQQWGTSEIGDVAAYLNAIYYKQPCTIPGCLGQSSVMHERDRKLESAGR